MAGLSQKEAELAERTEHLLALVEETEFGIALPTALRVLSREMRTIEGWLKEGDASPRTVALEKRVEEDLLGLLQAIRRLPPTTPPPAGLAAPLGPPGARARAEPADRRAEDDPAAPGPAQRRHRRVDKARPGAATLPARPPARDRGPRGHPGRDPRLARQDRANGSSPRGQPAIRRVPIATRRIACDVRPIVFSNPTNRR